MTMLASQITSLTVVYSIVYSGVNQRKHQSPASLAFVREIHRGPVNFPHKWPVTRKMFPFDDVIMLISTFFICLSNMWHNKSHDFHDSSCSWLCVMYWSQVLSREWKYSWSSSDRRCSNYIWVINNFIAYKGASYIRGITVHWYSFSADINKGYGLLSENKRNGLFNSLISMLHSDGGNHQSNPMYILQIIPRLFSENVLSTAVDMAI